MNTKEIGKKGEERVIKWLQGNNYTIIEKNFRKRNFEIDIIAICPANKIRFIEVKTVFRGNMDFAVYSALNRNFNKYLLGIDYFFLSNKQYLDYEYSIDIFVVYKNRIEIYENISSYI